MTEPIKTIKPETWFFDIETVPCIDTGRKVYDRTPNDIGLGDTDEDWAQLMYHEAGAILPLERVMLKTVFQRVVAISALVRKQTDAGVSLLLHSLPVGEEFDEKAMIGAFLAQLGTRRPQIVGFNHSGFDIPVLFQRAVIHGIEIGNFCKRPNKPWDDEPDYFSAVNEYNVDLMKVLGAWGKATPSLTEIAKACGIPAKIGADGSEVADMWFGGQRREIVAYCDCDVLTTYLLWLRTAMVSGLMTGAQAIGEQDLFRVMLWEEREDKPHVGEFLAQWEAANEFELEAAA